MSPRYAAKVLLKGRPTRMQMVDRVRPPVPDGLELYLDVADIDGDGWLDRGASLVRELAPADFALVVEGPLRSLDGKFFDVTEPNAANLEVVDRVVTFGKAIGAQAAVIHAMAARPDASNFDADAHEEALERSQTLFRHYAMACQSANMVPTVENVPPVARMRESSFMFSLIGTAPYDLLRLADVTPDLRFTLDISHAQLYVDAMQGNPDSFEGPLRPMVDYLRSQGGVASLDTCVDVLASGLYEAHISNARGLLGEGLPFDEGNIAMDNVIPKLARHVRYLVTETIEPDPEHAVHMREAQRRIADLMQGKEVR